MLGFWLLLGVGAVSVALVIAGGMLGFALFVCCGLSGTVHPRVSVGLTCFLALAFGAGGGVPAWPTSWPSPRCGAPARTG
jgi:hypothetical protein